MEQPLLTNTNLKPLSRKMAIISLGIFALSYTTNAMDRNIFPMLLNWISKSYAFDLKNSGFLATVFTLGCAIAAGMTGYLLDRWSRKTVIVMGMVIYSIATFATILATGFMDMLVYRTLTGIGEAMQLAGLFAAACSYFYKNKALAIGTINFGFGIGGFIGPYVGIKLLMATNENWHTPFIVYAVLGLILAALIWFVVPKVFTESKGTEQVSAIKQVEVSNIPEKLLNRNIMLCGLSALLWGSTLYAHMGLYPTFLINQLHFSPITASLSLSIYGIGCMFGIPAGWLGDRYSNRWFAICAWICAAIVWYFTYNVATEPWAQYVLSFLVGLFSSSILHPNSLSLAQRSARPELIGRVTGYFSACTYVTATFSGYIFAWLVGYFGWGGAEILQLTICPLIAVFALLLIKQEQLFMSDCK
ncbi:MAG: family transporter [Firmicutes bacterium]|nr:family transporter [Bacillota bacterium]